MKRKEELEKYPHLEMFNYYEDIMNKEIEGLSNEELFEWFDKDKFLYVPSNLFRSYITHNHQPEMLSGYESQNVYIRIDSKTDKCYLKYGEKKNNQLTMREDLKKTIDQQMIDMDKEQLKDVIRASISWLSNDEIKVLNQYIIRVTKDKKVYVVSHEMTKKQNTDTIGDRANF